MASLKKPSRVEARIELLSERTAQLKSQPFDANAIDEQAQREAEAFERIAATMSAEHRAIAIREFWTWREWLKEDLETRGDEPSRSPLTIRFCSLFNRAVRGPDQGEPKHALVLPKIVGDVLLTYGRYKWPHVRVEFDHWCVVCVFEMPRVCVSSEVQSDPRLEAALARIERLNDALLARCLLCSGEVMYWNSAYNRVKRAGHTTP